MGASYSDVPRSFFFVYEDANLYTFHTQSPNIDVWH